jgi:hypothetical protein
MKLSTATGNSFLAFYPLLPLGITLKSATQQKKNSSNTDWYKKYSDLK